MMQYDAIALMSPFRQSLGTACTVLYCLLWDGSDGVLDRAGGTETTPASGCEIHGETETLVHDSDVHENGCDRPRTSGQKIPVWRPPCMVRMFVASEVLRPSAGCEPCARVLLEVRQRSRHHRTQRTPTHPDAGDRVWYGVVSQTSAEDRD